MSYLGTWAVFTLGVFFAWAFDDAPVKAALVPSVTAGLALLAHWVASGRQA